MPLVRVELPAHLRTLARLPGRECELELAPEPTIANLLDELEARYPTLCGTVRDHTTLERRPYLRFFACQQDLSFEPHTAPLPAAVLNRSEPFVILGAVAGGTA